MPTGYTAIIESDKEVTFKEYALGCARNFGACITMRDDPADAEIPDEFKPSTYHINAIKNAEKGLKDLEKMTDQQIETQAKNEFNNELFRIDESLAKERRISDRYAEMKKKVIQWKPPTPDHVGLKDFMLQQIDVSTELNMLEVYEKERRELKIKSVQEWRDSKQKSLLF